MSHAFNETVLSGINRVCLDAYDRNRTDPIELIQAIWESPDFPMHCPEHHILVPAVLMTVYRSVRRDERKLLEENLKTINERGRNLLPGFCGYYGACGVGIGSGLFLAVFTDTTPMSGKTWGWANRLSSLCLGAVSTHGGPRCCKRVSYLTIETTLPFISENIGLELSIANPIECRDSDQNKECLRKNCPYYRENQDGE